MSSRALSIAVFSDSALPVLNGVSVSIDSLVRELRSRGHSVHLFTSTYPGHVDDDPNTHRFRSIRTPWTMDYPLAVPPFYRKLREFRRHRFDLIHTHTPFTVGFVGLRWAESHEIPIVSTYHTHYDKYTNYVPLAPKRYLRYKIAKHLNFYYNRVGHVITPSEASKRWIQRHSVHTPITVVPSGVPAPRMIDRSEVRSQLGISTDRKALLYAGRVAREKNLGVLLDGVATAMRQDSSLELIVLGDGPARAELTARARELGVGDHVRFVGFVPRPDVERYYAASDLFVFASMTETQGLVVVEAMSYGLPAIVVQGGGAGEVVEDGVNGRLVKNEPLAIARAIADVVGDDKRAAELSRGARLTSREFTIPAVTDRVVEVYNKAIATGYLPRRDFVGV